MDIIKVDAIDSTNTYLRTLNRKKNINKPVCVMAREQLAGKGQMGTVWQSHPGENLTCSVFWPIEGLALVDQFYISMSVSLAIMDFLQVLMIPKISIKWPNDILSYKQKICGVLIENVVKNGRLTGAIIGIGLNVNQSSFRNLPQAGSLKQITGKVYDLNELLFMLLQSIEDRIKGLLPHNHSRIKQEYESLLFRINKPSTFLDVKGDSFVGIIQSISENGLLQVMLEDEVIKSYDLKEIKMLY